jgi:hypothetical protein
MAQSRWSFRTIACAGSLLVLAFARADDPPKTNRTIDPAKLPPGSVIIISTNPREAFQNVDAVVLSPEEYRKLLDAAEQARKSPEKSETPSVCRLSGKIELRGNRDVAVLTADYRFRTTGPKAAVAVGLQKAKLTGAILDGRLAAFGSATEDSGFTVVADAAGDHILRIEFETPVVSRSKPGERGVEIGLPGSAITTLERLELPPGATQIRIGGRPAAAGALASGTATVLGPITALDITWDSRSTGILPKPLLAAEARTDLRIEERITTSHTHLTVRVLRGESNGLSLVAPADAEVTADSAHSVEKPSELDRKVWTIRREASGADFVVDIVVRTPTVLGRPFAIRPAIVVGAAQQRGTIVIGTAANVRLSFELSSGADIVRREPADESSRDAIFAYGRIPETGFPLVVTATVMTGQIESLIQHTLTLGDRGWRWQGKIDIRPLRMDVAQLEVEVPANWSEFRTTSADTVESVVPSRELPAGRRLMRLAAERSTRETRLPLNDHRISSSHGRQAPPVRAT